MIVKPLSRLWFKVSCDSTPASLHTQTRNASLAVAQVEAAMAVLPPEAVLAFNIGNEPDLERPPGTPEV